MATRKSADDSYPFGSEYPITRSPLLNIILGALLAAILLVSYGGYFYIHNT